MLSSFSRENDLHNRELEIKGNIRVFCRTRPILPSEIEAVNRRLEPDHKPSNYQSKQKALATKKAASHGEDYLPSVADTICFPKAKQLELLHKLPNGQTHPTRFKFDKVFTDDDDQECVFKSVQGVVKSALDGHNVCIFAYG